MQKMWRRLIAFGAVGMAGLVVLACANAAADETKTPDPTNASPPVFDLPANGNSSQTGASMPAEGAEPAETPKAGQGTDSTLGFDALDPNDPAVSEPSQLDMDGPAVSGPAISGPAVVPGNSGNASDQPLILVPPTDLYNPAVPSRPGSVPPSPPLIDDGKVPVPTHPTQRTPITGGPTMPGMPALPPDYPVSSPPQPAPGVNVPSPAPSGPTTPGLAPLPPGTMRELAPIDNADIVIRESFPPQYSVSIGAGLPGGCARQGGYEVERSGTTFRISIYNTMPSAPVACTMIYGMYQVNVGLDNIVSGTTYTVIVNDRTLTFTGQ